MTTRMIEVGSGPLAVDVLGGGDATPLLWAHGLTSSRAREDRFPLVDHARLASDRRVIRYDARGHGESSGSQDERAYGADRLARDLLALADALGIERFASGGISMGTATTLHAATMAPERITRMVLGGPPTAWATRPAQAELYRTGADLAAEHGPAVLVEGVEPPAIFAELYAGHERPLPEIDPSLLPTVLRGAASSDLPPEAAVAGLAHPTLVLAWTDDPGHPVSTALRLGELISGADVVVAADLAQVRGWTDRIAAFLAEGD